MPRELVPQSFVDDFGVIHLRIGGWITSYNPAIATSIRSNHDVSWIPTNTKTLTYIYYLTNYATKASPQQILVKARLLAESRQNLSSAVENTDCQEHKFLLRLYNSLTQDQEISGVQIASSLLQFPGHYATYSKFTHIQLPRLRSHFCALLLIRLLIIGQVPLTLTVP